MTNEIAELLIDLNNVKCMSSHVRKFGVLLNRTEKLPDEIISP